MTISPSCSSQQIDKPYKPKFHNASLYTKEESKSELNPALHQSSSSTVIQTVSTGPSTLSSAAAAVAAANNVHPLVKSYLNLYPLVN